MTAEINIAYEPLSELRAELIAMLEFPRHEFFKEIRARNCILDGVFCMQENKCFNCDIGDECLAINATLYELYITDSTKSLIERANVSLEYIHNKVDATHHDVTRCTCEACLWLRDAESTLSIIETYQGAYRQAC